MGIQSHLKPTDTVNVHISEANRGRKAAIQLTREGVRYESPSFLLAETDEGISVGDELKRAAEHVPNEYLSLLPDLGFDLPHRTYTINGIKIVEFKPQTETSGLVSVEIDVTYTEGEKYRNEVARWEKEIVSVLESGEPVSSAKALFEMNRYLRKWDKKSTYNEWEQRAVKHAITSTRNLIGMLITQTKDTNLYPLNPQTEIQAKGLEGVSPENIHTPNLLREIFLNWDSIQQILKSEEVGIPGGSGRAMGAVIRKQFNAYIDV